MKRSLSNRAWILSAASAAIALGAAPAFAQTSETEIAPATSEEVVVPGTIAYRNRSEETAPVLEYGLDYFQRFEPLTVGDALKRTPSVAFLSDVLESDGVRLRGLDPAYTQILINGEEVPGSGSSSGAFGNGAEGAFFVDRIPAELIERVEIVRSASANRSGDALAGAINIVLRDSYSLEGGYVRAGVLYFANDEHWGETLGAVWGGQVGPGRLLVGANLQDRHNPKDKLSLRFDAPGDPINNNEIQTDVRDGTDYSANFSYIVDVLGGELRLDGFYVHTDRDENEDSIEYSDGDVQAVNIETVNDNNVDITQDSYALNARYEVDMLGGETTFKLGFAEFTNEEDEIEDETEFQRDANPFPEADRFTRDFTRVDLTDQEWKFGFEHERDLSDVLELEFGVQLETKERDNFVGETPRIRFNLPGGTQQTGAAPPSGIPAFGPVAAIDGGDNTIERDEVSPFVMLEGEAPGYEWELGLRYEMTDVRIEDRTTASTTSTSYEVLLPSAHIKIPLTENDRLFGSVARTVRNPSFAFLSPALLIGELEDNDFQGNPFLKPERAWGIDVGYERRLGRTGVAGVNVFWRDVSDLIEVFNTGAEGDEGPGTFVYSARNTGDGQVWGIEFDLSTSLSAIGLEDTGVFVNYSWLDSDVQDEFGGRMFNSQAESVFNIGFIQDIPAWAAAFGATYRNQGEAFSRVVSEEVTTTYGADLEIFVEKRIGDSFTIRLTGSNLLDAEKEEEFNKFLTAADQQARAFDEYELETESAGPVFQLIGRYAF
ncbi:MAG: TonB-dependent receptor [Alphaproteobacteria bacterium]|nr:TonB-dependent receptor [Alphaproteobacteria bacterium]